MPALILYLIKFSISLSSVYLFYQLVLRRLTFYSWNRWFLLGYSLLSFAIPFVNIQPIVENRNLENSKAINYIPVVENYSKDPVRQVNIITAKIEQPINYWNVLLGVLLIGAIIMLFRFIIQFSSLQKVKKNSTINKKESLNIYQVDKNIIPFSFGNSIFINPKLHSEKEFEEIILHEYVHVKQKHTVDILFSEFLCIINWYNPFAWLIRHDIRQNLEFIADDLVLKDGIDKKAYQYHLLKVIGSPQYRIANNFNFSSLKKRIVMMNRFKSAKVQLAKFLFLFPLIAVLLVAFRDKYNGIFKKQFDINEAGIVVDINSKLPIAGVAVSDTVSGVSAITDERGFYSLKIPVKVEKNIVSIAMKFIKKGYKDNTSSSMIDISKLQSHGQINITALVPLNEKASFSFFGLSPFNNKFPDNPTYEDALAQFKKIKHESDDWDLYLKLEKDHPEVNLFYTSEYKTGNIVFYKGGTIEKYGFAGSLTYSDMGKKFGKLPDVMTKNELPLPVGYLAKWNSVANEAGKKFHTNNPAVTKIVFPGDSRAIVVLKDGSKPYVYDLDNAVPEERPLFEKLYGSLDGIVPPAENFVNIAHNDERYKDWKVRGIEFWGFTKVDLDKDNSLTNFSGEGFLQINNSAKALIIYNNKEFSPDEFKKQFGNLKFNNVSVYENEGAFKKYGNKGRNGVILIKTTESIQDTSGKKISDIGHNINLAGFVLDANTRHTISHAKLYCPESGKFFYADGNGYYKIQIPYENRELQFSIIISKDGYNEFNDHEHWGNLYNDRIREAFGNTIEFFGITKKGEKDESFGLIKGSFNKESSLDYDNVLKIFLDNCKARLVGETTAEINFKLWIIDFLQNYLNDPKSTYQLIPVNIGIGEPKFVQSLNLYNELQKKRKVYLQGVNKNDSQIKEIDEQLKSFRENILSELHIIRNHCAEELIKQE